MTNVNEADDKVTKWIRWITRIWGGLIVGIALLMFIGDVANWVTTGTADPYAMENPPPIESWPPRLIVLSAVGLALAWRWEGLGGAIAVVFQLAMLPLLLIHWPISEDSRFVAPYLVLMVIATPGVLFLICWWRSREIPEIPE